MGQRTHGILYGIQVFNGATWIGEDGDGGVLAEYTAARKPDIAATATRLGLAPWNIERRFVPDTEYVDDERCRFVGFWVAAGHGIRGAMLLSGVGVREKYPVAGKNAHIRWRKFARWCGAKSIEVDDARLWLLETEVA